LLSCGIATYLPNGDGTFRAVFSAQSTLAPVDWSTATITAGDFNGDGRTDVEVSSLGLGGVLDYLSNGDGTFHEASGPATSLPRQLDFGLAVSDEQLWLARSGNDLQIDVMGTTSQRTVSNWFAPTGNQPLEITAGGLKLDNQVAQLVQAMATYSSNNPGFNPVAASQVPNDTALQNTIAAAWHS
jgi:hypothetical protein